MARIGVFICHCGENISATVDVQKVAAAAAKISGVAHSVEYKYMCSDPGQQMIKNAIREKNLTGVVVAACSPRMHEPTFRRACAEAGLNPFLLQMANIREHVSWVTKHKESATEKVKALIAGAVARVPRDLLLFDILRQVQKQRDHGKGFVTAGRPCRPHLRHRVGLSARGHVLDRAVRVRARRQCPRHRPGALWRQPGPTAGGYGTHSSRRGYRHGPGAGPCRARGRS